MQPGESAGSVIFPCSILLRMGFAWPADHPAAGGLLHRLCTLALTARAGAVCFCGTVLGVSPTGRYPASCPAESGLSSTLPPRSPGPLWHRAKLPGWRQGSRSGRAGDRAHRCRAFEQVFVWMAIICSKGVFRGHQNARAAPGRQSRWAGAASLVHPRGGAKGRSRGRTAPLAHLAGRTAHAAGNPGFRIPAGSARGHSLSRREGHQPAASSPSRA